MDDEVGHIRNRSNGGYVRQSLTSCCATPRHGWRAISWMNKKAEHEAGSIGNSGGISEPGEDSPSRVCPPFGSLSISQNYGNREDENQQEQQTVQTKHRNGGGLKLDLGAVKNVQDSENFGLAGNKTLRLNLEALGKGGQERGCPELSDSDMELLVRRDKMAECDKQCTQVLPHLFFGGKGVAENYSLLRSSRITHILNCVGFICPEYFPNDFLYKTLWLDDSPSEDIICVLYDVFDFFEDIHEQASARVFVHCCEGVSRSAALVIAYLMWREHRSFEEVFEDVKRLRSVTSPNIGFVFQLMQWQNKILDPLIKEVPSVYRIAPQSTYDPLYLVPKATSSVSMDVLDSRGAFIVQLVNRLYVWRGRKCDRAMMVAADRAAFQLLRYEHAQGPIISVREGREPQALLAAICPGKHSPHSIPKNFGPQGAALKLVSGYNKDYEMYITACREKITSHKPGRFTRLATEDGRWNLFSSGPWRTRRGKGSDVNY